MDKNGKASNVDLNSLRSKKGDGFFIEGEGDDDDGEDEDDEDDEDGEIEAKELASRTLKAVRWLYENERLTLEEKRVITSDIVSNVSAGKFSKTEVAFSLLLGGGRPGEVKLVPQPALNMWAINVRDTTEFEDCCHRIASSLRRKK